MSRSALPMLAFVACGLIWGTTFLAIRIGNDSLPALWACTLRLCLATLVLNFVLVATRQPWPRGDALKGALWYGFLEFGVSLPLLYWGEKVVPSGLAAVLYALCPITAMFAAKAMGLETLSSRKLGAAVLAVAGVAVIFWREILQGGGSPVGLAAIVLAAISAPMAGVMLQRAPNQSPIGANAVGSLVAIPTCLAASFALGERHAFPSTFSEVFPVVYLAIASSVGAFVIFAWLMLHWRVTTVAFLGVVVPVIAVAAGALARSESFAPLSAVGAIIVIVGVVIALVSDKGRSPSAE